MAEETRADANSQQLLSKGELDAVWREHSGYLLVNYDRLELKFMTLKE